MALKRKLERSRGIPGPTKIPPPPPPDQVKTDEVYHIPFTIPEIDRIMSVMLDLNVPVRTYLLLDEKFGEIKRKSLGLSLVGGGTKGKEEIIIHDNGPGEANKGDNTL